MTKARLVEVRRDASHLETKYLSSSFLPTQTIFSTSSTAQRDSSAVSGKAYARKSSIVTLRRREIAIRTALGAQPMRLLAVVGGLSRRSLGEGGFESNRPDQF
jgi:hypothetical protein